MGKAGKRQVISQTHIDSITDYIRRGATNDRAARLSGIVVDTLYKWRRRGEQDIRDGRNTTYVKFVYALKAAQDSFKQKCIDLIMDAAQGRLNELGDKFIRLPQWQAAAWLLERKFPREFARKDPEFGADRTADEVAEDVGYVKEYAIVSPDDWPEPPQRNVTPNASNGHTDQRRDADDDDPKRLPPATMAG